MAAGGGTGGERGGAQWQRPNSHGGGGWGAGKAANLEGGETLLVEVAGRRVHGDRVKRNLRAPAAGLSARERLVGALYHLHQRQLFIVSIAQLFSKRGREDGHQERRDHVEREALLERGAHRLLEVRL